MISAGKGSPMQYFASDGAPNAIGPYSQAVRRGKTIYTSGQTPIDPKTGKLVDGDFEANVRQVFENLKAVLAASGASLNDVVKTTVFIRSFSDFQKMNAVYAEYFGTHRPARSTIGVASLPLDAPVEIEMIAELE